MRSSKDIQKDILMLMNELFQAQEEEKKRIRNELNDIYVNIDHLSQKNRKIAEILMED